MRRRVDGAVVLVLCGLRKKLVSEDRAKVLHRGRICLDEDPKYTQVVSFWARSTNLHYKQTRGLKRIRSQKK